MTAERVEWTSTDDTTCGRFSIESEHVRGERRFYMLRVNEPKLAALYDASRLDGSTDKRVVKRQAQRLVDMLAASTQPASPTSRRLVIVFDVAGVDPLLVDPHSVVDSLLDEMRPTIAVGCSFDVYPDEVDGAARVSFVSAEWST